MRNQVPAFLNKGGSAWVVACVLGISAMGEGQAQEAQNNTAPSAESKASEATASPKTFKKGEGPKSFASSPDQNGFLWTVLPQGVIRSNGEPQVLASSMDVKVGGVKFELEEVTRDAQDFRLTVKGKAGSVPVHRDVVLEPKLSALRYLDRYENTTDQELGIVVEYQLSVRQAGERFVTTSNQSFDGSVKMPEKDYGFMVVLGSGNQEEPAPSVMVVTCSPEYVQKPLLVRNNLENVQWVFELKIPPKSSLSLLQWIGIGFASDDSAGPFRTLYDQGKLVPSRVSEEELSRVANFHANEIARDAAQASSGGAHLVNVRQLEARSGLTRGAHDLLWLGPNSVLSGEIQAFEFDLKSRFGTHQVKMEELAALQGGGSQGRPIRAFFRDGTVLQGEIDEDQALQFKTTESWDMTVPVSKLETLFFKSKAEDGVIPKFEDGGEAMVLAFSSGENLLLSAASGAIKGVTPWGELLVPLAEISKIQFIPEPAPSFVWELKNGAVFRGLIGDQELTASMARVGEQTMRPVELLALWSANSPPSEELLEFEAPEELAESESSMALLMGGNQFPARLAGSEIVFAFRGVDTKVNAQDVIGIRVLEAQDDIEPEFSVKMKSGSVLTGRIRERFISFEVPGGTWEVPTSQLRAYHAGKTLP